jgi:poly(beta-D-mannuronate) lyase
MEEFLMKKILAIVSLLTLVLCTFLVVYAEDPTPLSQGKPVTFSSEQNDKNNPNGAANAVDGDIWESRWAAFDGKYPQWLKVDLGEIKHITQFMVKFYKYNERAYRYTIEVSNDDQTYTMAADKAKNGKQGERTENVDVSGRYVRINVLGCSADTGWASIIEFRVFGK